MRRVVVFFCATALAAACDRADREITPFRPADVTVGSFQGQTAGGGGAGGVGGAGGAGGGTGGGSFCDGPGVFCQECAQCLLGSDCALPLSECDGQLECAQALECLRICRDGCVNDPACLAGCHQSCEQSAPGYGAALDVLDCFCRLGCPTSCASQFSSECIAYLP
jgi:hypothetical protein